MINGIMLDVKIDPNDPLDLFEQVASEIRRALADGEAKPGERLPPARDLAAVLGVNANTVLRALRLLRCSAVCLGIVTSGSLRCVENIDTALTHSTHR